MTRRTDPTDWMWAQAVDLIAQAERMHRRFFRLHDAGPGQTVWEPPVDVFEDEREILVIAALPGVAAEHVEVVVEPGAISIRADRPQLLGGSRYAVCQMEIPYGRFARRVPLPHALVDAVSSELTHGCLVVRLRKIG
jgi:HSP20 family protein